MSVADLLSGLRRSSKKDEVPGSVLEILNERCPICAKQLKKYRPCCGSPYGYKGCNCDYKVILTNDSV